MSLRTQIKGLRKSRNRHSGRLRCSAVFIVRLPSLVAGPAPKASRIPCRNRSRSSGVMWPWRSAMRRRKLECPRPWSPSPPKRMRQSASSPTACQNVISRQPNSDGNNQFHSNRTTSPPTKINNAIARIASGINSSFFFLIFCSSFLRKFVINALQSLAQMQHRITFAREQRVHAHAGLG